MPVSYTHLDVYKRQGKQDADDVIQHIAPAVGGCIAKQLVEQRIPVSYTHLIGATVSATAIALSAVGMAKVRRASK